MKKLLFFIFLIVTLLSVSGFFYRVEAADFEVEVEKIYVIDSPEKVDITEIRRVSNKSSNRIISKDNQEVFQIIVTKENSDKLNESFATSQSFINGRITQSQNGKQTEDTLEVAVPYDSSIGIGGTKEFKLTYSNFGLTQTTGALLDIFAPGFGKDYTFENNNTKYSHKITIKLNKNLGEVGFVVPTPANTSTEGNYIVYQISQESLIASSIWIQIGKTQYYHFILTQKVKASDSINKGYSNEYNLVIPRDMNEAETVQQIYFKKFDPEPKQIIEDDEGNLIATFKIPSHQDSIITVEGYAQVQKIEKQANKENSGVLGDIEVQSMINYLNPAEFWEVDHPEIQTKAKELKGDKTNIYEIIESNYSHIVDTIDYSEVKRFGINNRQGALKTLNGGAAVCMEYSDLFLALSRAQGIPARASFGYGYDARIGEEQQDAHQWVQVYLPGLNEWLSVDVTWGESGPALIGGDLNHFYTHIASIDPDTPPSVQRVSYGNQVGLEPPEFEIKATKELPRGEVLSSSEEVLERYPNIEKTEFEMVFDNLVLRIQTSNLPASMSRNANYMVYAGIGLFALSGLILLKVLVNKILRKFRKPKLQQPQEIF